MTKRTIIRGYEPCTPQICHYSTTTLRMVRLTHVTEGKASIYLRLTATAPTTAYLLCGVPSASIHSRYWRRLTDLPWGTRVVRIHLRVRKFVCRHPHCARRIFTECLPELVAPYVRNTPRLIMALQALGMALGGKAGVRLAARLKLTTSPATLLRLVRAASKPLTPALQAVGIDEWAWQRGHRYGTILKRFSLDHTGLCRSRTWHGELRD